MGEVLLDGLCVDELRSEACKLVVDVAQDGAVVGKLVLASFESLTHEA